MSKTPHAKPRSGRGKRGRYLFRLFVASNGPNSQQAMVNLQRLCREHLNGNCKIETIDVTKDYQAAVTNNILVTPALILVAPRPHVVILGNLSDSRKVLAALRLSGSES